MIQPPDRPKYFYKYKYIDEGKPDYSRRIFTHNELHFSNPSIFNDPFDCKFRLELKGSDAEKHKYRERLLKEYDPSLNRKSRRSKVRKDRALLDGSKFQKSFEEGAQEKVGIMGICCFSELRDSILMWAHYANAHRGFCLEFLVEPKPKGSSRKYEILEPHQVMYLAKYPIVNWPEDRGLTLAKKTVLAKAEDWKYEKEWRMVDLKGKGPHQFPSRFLTGVIFGCRMPENHKKMVRDWCEDRETTIEYYEAQLSDNSYSLKIIPAP